MDLHDLDQALEQLRSDTDRAGANLFELDRTPARSLLAVAGLDGVSRQRWAEAEQALDCLFQSYATLSATVEAAAAERGTGPTLSAARRARVASLVLSPSVEVPERAVPLAERDLVGVSRIVRRCTPGELLAAMAAPFELARSVILGAAEAWAVGRPQVQDFRQRLAAIVADGGREGIADDAAVLERRLAELEHLLVTDPLAYDRAEVDELGERVRALAAAGEAARCCAGGLRRRHGRRARRADGTAGGGGRSAANAERSRGPRARTRSAATPCAGCPHGGARPHRLARRRAAPGAPSPPSWPIGASGRRSSGVTSTWRWPSSARGSSSAAGFGAGSTPTRRRPPASVASSSPGWKSSVPMPRPISSEHRPT